MSERSVNTISDHDFQVFMNQRARALERMSRKKLKKHLTTYKQIEAARQGRN